MSLRIFNGLVYGIFEMEDESGYPLVDSLKFCKEHNLIMSMQDYIGQALIHDWDDTKIATKLHAAYLDMGYNPKYEDILHSVKLLILSKWDGKMPMYELGQKLIIR